MKVLSIRDLNIRYGSEEVLEGICLDADEGDYLGIIGPNGGGKSTLLKAVLGLIKPDSGHVEVFGKAPGQGGVGYVPQFATMDRLFPINVLEVTLTGRVRPGLSPFFRYRKEDREIAESLLERVGMGALMSRQVSELSGGEFQRMLIARALAARPRLLLLDEPTASVDARARQQIYDILGELNREMTIILVTHDLMAVSSQVRTLACLNRTLIYHGEPELSQEVVGGLYGCPVDLIAHGLPHRVLRDHDHDHDHAGGKTC